MNIVWCSARNLGVDLASTTQASLCKALAESGDAVRLASPGSSTDASFTHIPIPRSARRGFQAWSVARNIANQWDSIVHGADAVILDWQLARHLAPLAVDSNVPWYLMDRSPPADASLLTYLQKMVWKRAWKYATSTASGGFSVSEAHSAYIARIIGSELPIKSIPAGVDGFSHARDPDLGPDPIRLIYHGRLDKNRAVLDLPEVLSILDSKGFAAEMTLLGQGDAVRQLERSCASAPNLRVIPQVHRDEVPGLLAGHHIGMLPMPRTEIWSIASPLKLVEYAAAGLHVVGIDHEGHRWEGQEDWLHLIEGGRGWIERAARTIMMLHRGGLERSKQAQAAAATRTWAASAQRMLDAMA